MSKQELQDLVVILMGYSTAEKLLDERVVSIAADAVRSKKIADYVSAEGDTALELFCVAKVLDVSYDAERDRKYCQLPFQILGLKDRSGVVQVSLVQEEDTGFVPIPTGMVSVYNGLEAGGLAGKIGYWVEAGKLMFKNLPGGIDKILLKSIPEFNSITSDNEQIPQPSDFNPILIEGVRTWLEEQKITPEDRVTDSRDTTVING